METRMSIYKFAFLYYGVKLPLQLQYTHEDLKTMLGLTSCSFEYANKNIDLVCRGIIVLVYDSFDRTLPYIPPRKNMEEFIPCEVVKDEVRTHDDIDLLHNLDKLDTFSTYQLRKLLSEFKEIVSVYRRIRRELIRRGVYENKMHKLAKERLIIEEKEKDGNVEYKRKRKFKRKKS